MQLDDTLHLSKLKSKSGHLSANEIWRETPS